MISLLHGTVKEIAEQEIVLDCGSIGFEIQVPDSSLFTIGNTIDLFIHLHWNQEQGPSLYGFKTVPDRQIFQLIISCSGMGPKIALAILHQLGTPTFLQAIQTDDEQTLSRVSGIGSKKAEQMIVNLRHKVKKWLSSGATIDIASVQAGQQWNDLINALESLHYSRPEINKAVKYLSKNQVGQLPFEQLMRKALAFLSKRV